MSIAEKDRKARRRAETKCVPMAPGEETQAERNRQRARKLVERHADAMRRLAKR